MDPLHYSQVRVGKNLLYKDEFHVKVNLKDLNKFVNVSSLSFLFLKFWQKKLRAHSEDAANESRE